MVEQNLMKKFSVTIPNCTITMVNANTEFVCKSVLDLEKICNHFSRFQNNLATLF